MPGTQHPAEGGPSWKQVHLQVHAALVAHKVHALNHGTALLLDADSMVMQEQSATLKVKELVRSQSMHSAALGANTLAL